MHCFGPEKMKIKVPRGRGRGNHVTIRDVREDREQGNQHCVPPCSILGIDLVLCSQVYTWLQMRISSEEKELINPLPLP